MSKSKTEEKAEPLSPFMGGEDDDLSDMKYVQDETTASRVETHPPETEEEAALVVEEPEAKVEEEEEPEAEAEEEPEAEAEEEPEAEAEEEEVTSQKIPKERFDEVNERMKRAEERLRELEEERRRQKEEVEVEPEPEPYDFDAKEQEAMDAILQGEEDKYKAIRKEIREKQQEELLREARKLAESGDKRTIEDQKFERAGMEIESEWPQFDADSETFNQEARDELIDLYAGYVNSGRYSRVAALRRAAEKAARLYGFNEKAEIVEENVVSITKKKTDVKQKKKLAESQPPSMTGHGEGREEPKVDVTRMSEEAWDALPESTKRRLRGDFL